MKQTIHAKIYQPAKTAMQSGRAKTNHWVLEFERPTPAAPDALMGWNTQLTTQTQVKLNFSTKEEAIAYAQSKELTFSLAEPKKSVVAPKAYAENFAYTRRTSFDANS